METTRLSSKGQIILPASIRAAKHWKAGIEFVVEQTDDGVLLRPLKAFAATTLRDVAGCVNYKGKTRTLEEMDDAVTKEIGRRHARG